MPKPFGGLLLLMLLETHSRGTDVHRASDARVRNIARGQAGQLTSASSSNLRSQI